MKIEMLTNPKVMLTDEVDDIQQHTLTSSHDPAGHDPIRFACT